MSSVEPERKEQSRLLQEPAQDLLPWSICEWAGLVCACAMLNTWCIKAHDLSKFFGGTRKIRYRSNTRELCLPTGRLVSSEESLRTLGQRVPAVSATAWWFPNGREADELSQGATRCIVAPKECEWQFMLPTERSYSSSTSLFYFNKQSKVVDMITQFASWTTPCCVAFVTKCDVVLSDVYM